LPSRVSRWRARGQPPAALGAATRGKGPDLGRACRCAYRKITVAATADPLGRDEGARVAVRARYNSSRRGLDRRGRTPGNLPGLRAPTTQLQERFMHGGASCQATILGHSRIQKPTTAIGRWSGDSPRRCRAQSCTIFRCSCPATCNSTVTYSSPPRGPRAALTTCRSSSRSHSGICRASIHGLRLEKSPSGTVVTRASATPIGSGFMTITGKTSRFTYE